MQLFSFSFEEITYNVDASFDDIALMDNAISFDVIAKRLRGGEEDRVSARVEIFPWENKGKIIVEGMEVFEFQLMDRGDSRFEQFVQSIPVPDPILGCALKAGISSIIGQAVDCCRQLHNEGLWGQIKAFAQCMRENVGRIGKTALRRAFGCMISGGLF